MMGRAEVKKQKKTLPLLDPIVSTVPEAKAS